MMMLVINCSGCRTPLQQPPGSRSIRCAVCHAVTRVVSPQVLTPSRPPSQDQHCSSVASYSPSPYAVPGGPPPSPHGKKRAVICGICYRYPRSRYKLKGSINDSRCMKYLLVKRFGFPEASILMLTEEETDPYRIPTKHNIRLALFWLVQGCQYGDSLVFYYSGHGSQQRNYTGDEIDGFDETLCPLDFETQGMIVDDEINAAIVRPLPRGVKLHAFIDACHSGTVLDLPFLCRMNRSEQSSSSSSSSSKQYVWEDHRPRSGLWKGTSGGEAISFSGCDDDQTSSDTSALSRTTSTGAMTYCFIQAIEHGRGSTYGSILNSMRSTIRNAADSMSGSPITSLITMLLTGGSLGGRLRQEPQLTACEPFDIYAKPFAL